MLELAKKLRALRERHELTQEQAAALIGVGLKYYQAVESGRKKQIWLETVNRFAEAYGLSLQEFFASEIPRHSQVSQKTPTCAHYAPRARKLHRQIRVTSTPIKPKRAAAKDTIRAKPIPPETVPPKKE